MARGLSVEKCDGEKHCRNFVVDLHKNWNSKNCGGYNKSELTREFLRRIGVTPRFSTPYHPEENFLIERYQAVIKSDDPSCSALRKEGLAPFNPLRIMGLS